MSDQPSPFDQDQGVLVQHEIVECINRLIIEGVDRRIIMAGVGAAACDLVTCTFGLGAVPTWFDEQAAVARALIAQAG